MVGAGCRRPPQIRASGGGLASPLWRQILADVLDAELATATTTEGAAFGAAVLAAVGRGWFADVAAATAALVTTTPGRVTRARARRAIAEAHARYRDAVPGAGAASSTAR